MKKLLSLLTVAGLALAACGGDDASSSTAPVGSTAGTSESTQTTTDAAGADEFPVTITHKYGEVTIPEQPLRVVSVGFSDQDWLLALGVVPIAIRDWYGDQPYATWPWAQDELGDAAAVVLSSTEANFEQIAALKPDLIVGVSSGMTDTDYETLSQIAPTIAQPGEYVDYGTPWDVATELIGKATGTSEEAAAVIERVEGLYADVREAHPEFEGATAGVTFMFDGSPGGYGSQDGRSRLVNELGFVTPPEFDELSGDSFFFTVSSEDISVLDTDVVIWIVGDELSQDAVAALPTRQSLSAFAEGREIITDPLLSGAFSFGSPLSIEYLLENLVPELALAVDGDPATVVPSAERIGHAGAEGAAPAADDDEAAAAGEAFTTVFDSTVPFAEKAEWLENSEALQAAAEAYSAAGESMGGIALAPTAVVVDGATATITYDVLFGGTPAYEALTSTITKVDGAWVVSQAAFCEFLTSARVACP